MSEMVKPKDRATKVGRVVSAKMQKTIVVEVERRVQHAEYKDHDPRDLPVEPVRDASGGWVSVSVPIAE